VKDLTMSGVLDSASECEQGPRVRYVTTAQLVNELVEAADDRVLSRVVGRYGPLDLLCFAWTSSAASKSTPAAPSCSSRSSPNVRNVDAFSLFCVLGDLRSPAESMRMLPTPAAGLNQSWVRNTSIAQER
jgi:hypothetical protein